MKTINYGFNGGLPLSQNILEWSQNGLKEVVKNICDMGYDGEPTVLTGCVYDSATDDVSAGYIYDGTEVLYFPGGNTVTAGTENIKIQQTDTTVVFESGASNPVKVNREYIFDNTGTVNIVTIRRWGFTDSSFIMADNSSEVAGSIDVLVNKATRSMQILGSMGTTGASALGSAFVKVTVIDALTLESDAVFGAYYPTLSRGFSATVSTVTPGIVDVNSHPFTAIQMILDENGLHAILRKTASADYNFNFTFVLFLDT